MEPEKGLPTAGRWCWQCCETLLQKVEQGTWLAGRQAADVVSRPRPMPWVISRSGRRWPDWPPSKTQAFIRQRGGQGPV